MNMSASSVGTWYCQYARCCFLTMTILFHSTIAETLHNQVDGINLSVKEIVCIPCSQTYLASSCDSHDNLLLDSVDKHNRFYLTGSCEGVHRYAGNLSSLYLNRELVGEGSHRRLVSTLQLGHCSDVVSLHEYDNIEVVIIEKLPSGVFADPFELQHFVKKRVLFDAAVFGDTNLERPSALSNRSIVEIHMEPGYGDSVNLCQLVVELPLHARYPPLDSGGYALVEIDVPDVYIVPKKENIQPDSLCAVRSFDAPNMKAVKWLIPCGYVMHSEIVSLSTSFFALVCALAIVLSPLFFHSANGIGHS